MRDDVEMTLALCDDGQELTLYINGKPIHRGTVPQLLAVRRLLVLRAGDRVSIREDVGSLPWVS